MVKDIAAENRNWLISVLFIDIVGFSKTAVDDQMEMKLVLNSAITNSITEIRTEERVILDTGDGAAVCFLSDPEQALKSSMLIREKLEESNQRGSYPVTVRMGINLGPVKLVKDLNGVLNAVGDGINVGQRVMSFAGDGELTASRSFMEVVACIHDDYPKLFIYEGPKKDKHGREHIIYKIQTKQEQRGNTGPLILSEDDLSHYQSALAASIGPIAGVIVKRTAASAKSHLELVDRIAKEVEEGVNREKFIARLKSFAADRDALRASTNPSVSISDTQPAAYCPVTIDTTVLADAERALAAYIGPVAKVLVKRAATEAHSVKTLLESLSQHIPEQENREEFLRSIMVR